MCEGVRILYELVPGRKILASVSTGTRELDGFPSLPGLELSNLTMWCMLASGRKYEWSEECVKRSRAKGHTVDCC